MSEVEIPPPHDSDKPHALMDRNKQHSSVIPINSSIIPYLLTNSQTIIIYTKASLFKVQVNQLIIY